MDETASMPAGIARFRQPLEATAAPRRFQVLKRLVRNRAALAGAVIVLLFVVMALGAMIWTPYPYDVPVLDMRFGSPSLVHPLGNDDVGRDILTRIAVGARFSLLMGMTA